MEEQNLVEPSRDGSLQGNRAVAQLGYIEVEGTEGLNAESQLGSHRRGAIQRRNPSKRNCSHRPHRMADFRGHRGTLQMFGTPSTLNMQGTRARTRCPWRHLNGGICHRIHREIDLNLNGDPFHNK